jgi:hypothetical protein
MRAEKKEAPCEGASGRTPASLYGRLPVGKGQAAAGFSAVLAPGAAVAEGAGAVVAAGAAGLAAGGFLAARFVAFFAFLATFFLADFLADFLAAFLPVLPADLFFAAFLADFLADFFLADFLDDFLADFFAAFFAFLAVAMINLLKGLSRMDRRQTRPPQLRRAERFIGACGGTGRRNLPRNAF